MLKFDITTILSCVVILQGANTQTCQSTKMMACVSNLTTSAESGGLDGLMPCRDIYYNSYWKCFDKVATDCNLHPSDNSIIWQVVSIAKQQSATIGCGRNEPNCATHIIELCNSNFVTVAESAKGDKTKLCSAANYFLNCMNAIFTDCKLDTRNSSVISQAITNAKTQLTKVRCGVNTQDCDTSKVQACAQNAAAAAAFAKGDKTKLCSAAHNYFNCVDNIVTDCNLDPDIDQTVLNAKTQLAAAGCVVNGAIGSIYSTVAIVLGVCLHRLF